MSDDSMQIMKWREYEAPSHIPFSMLCEEQAQRNHGQTLARLNERGGLSPKECFMLMDQLSVGAVGGIDEQTAARLITKRFLERYENEQLQARCADAEADRDQWERMCRAAVQSRDIKATAIKRLESDKAQQQERIAELEMRHKWLLWNTVPDQLAQNCRAPDWGDLAEDEDILDRVNRCIDWGLERWPTPPTSGGE